MTDNLDKQLGEEAKRPSRAKAFFKRVGKIIINNWQYKLVAVFTAFVLWLVIPYIF